MTVAEDEPSSVIAYCLLSSSYREQLQKHVDFIAVQRSANSSVSQSVLLWPEKTHIEVSTWCTSSIMFGFIVSDPPAQTNPLISWFLSR